MKPGRIAVVIAGGLLLAGGFYIANQKSTIETESAKSAAQVADAAPAKGQSDKAEQKPAEQNPEVYFLKEAGTSARDDRPKANLMPKANGNRRIGNVRALTSADEGDFMKPRWSPDGLELLFSKAGYSGLYTKGVNGGDITQVTGKDGTGYSAEWTADGKIKTRTNDGEAQTFDSDGTPIDSSSPLDDSSVTGAFNVHDSVYHRANPGEAPIPISTGEDRYYGGVVSPDGKYIAYNGLETGIYVRPVDGSSPPVHIGNGSDPSFMPDSSGIVFSVTNDDGHYLVEGDLYMSSLDGSTISALTNGSPSIEMKPTVSPDGSTIAFESDGVIFIGSLQ